MRAHSTDPTSLVFGFIFLGVAGLWALSRLVTLHAVVVGWTVVGALVMLGALGIAGSIASTRRHTDDQQP